MLEDFERRQVEAGDDPETVGADFYSRESSR